MNWEETIKYIRKLPEYNYLVEKAYFDENLELNVERFKVSEEYAETKNILRFYAPLAKTILDVGSGNGISSIAFALDGYQVTVSEPDPSTTVGAGAIRKLKEHYCISNMEIYEEYAEEIRFEESMFDVVYIRQAMHHAYDLKKFLKNLANLIKPGGILLTIRDHVIFDKLDKQFFLENHPLQKYYGGENAFTEHEYKSAMQEAGLKILKILKYHDSVINYFPTSFAEHNSSYSAKEKHLKESLYKKIGILGMLPFLFSLYKRIVGFNRSAFFNEHKVPGRMYSFVAIK